LEPLNHLTFIWTEFLIILKKKRMEKWKYEERKKEKEVSL